MPRTRMRVDHLPVTMTPLPNRIGLMPAAGHARRLGKIEGSKELLPVNSLSAEQPVCANLLRQFRNAEAHHTCIVLRHTKTDIPAALGSGKDYGVSLHYIFVDSSPSVPHSIDAAYSEIKHSEVLFGFPDILIKPANALEVVAVARAKNNSDVMLGLFPSTQPEKVDMVEYDKHGGARAIIIKDPACTLHEAWLLAAWGPSFTAFLHQWVAGCDSESASEPHLGDVINAAIDQGLKIGAHRFPNGDYLDIGTPEDLAKAQRQDRVAWV